MTAKKRTEISYETPAKNVSPIDLIATIIAESGLTCFELAPIAGAILGEMADLGDFGAVVDTIRLECDPFAVAWELNIVVDEIKKNLP